MRDNNNAREQYKQLRRNAKEEATKKDGKSTENQRK